MSISRRLTNKALRRFAFCLLAVLVAGSVGCGVPGPTGRADSYNLDFSLPPEADVSGAIVFVVDGLNASFFQEMLDAGELPQIRKYFVERGLYAPRAVANIPSVTLANLTSIVTGEYCGHHGIVGVNFFDRNRCLWRNYETIAQKNTLDGDYTSTTLFEHFPDRTTFSVFFQPHRGATKFVENWTSAGPPFYFRWYEFVDRLTLFRFNIVADVARKRRRFPAVTIAYLLASDFRAYDHGFSSKEYRDSLLHADRQIGRVCGDLARDGLLEKLHLAIVSDHGHQDVARHFPLEQFLREQVGLEIADGRLWEETTFEKRMEYYRKFPAVMYGSGDRYVAICLRKPRNSPDDEDSFEAWTSRPAEADLKNYPIFEKSSWLEKLFPVESKRPAATRNDLLSVLVKLDAVDLVAYAGGSNRVRVL
ncbi:MAG: alkaline phosphatase family protein, partial [Planctomycetota bacterium]